MFDPQTSQAPDAAEKGRKNGGDRNPPSSGRRPGPDDRFGLLIAIIWAVTR
jgi:hypothetical protein